MQNKSTVLTLLDRQNPDKANIGTLIEIIKELGKIPDTFTLSESVELDFELVAKINWYAAKQQGSEITLEEVKQKMDLDNIFELLEYGKSFLTITVPKEIQKKIDDMNKAMEKDNKVDGDKNPKKDVDEN
jgi:hypothetical protein